MLLSVTKTSGDDAQWTELERILQLDEDTNGVARARAPPAIWTWTDAWGVYEDVCLVCARLCSCLWRNNANGSTNSTNGLSDQWSWTARARRERRAEVRARGEGIEGRPVSYRRRGVRIGKYDYSDASGETDGGIGEVVEEEEEEEEEEEDGAVLVRSRQTRTTLALLQTFHAQTRFLLSRLATVLPSSNDAQLMTPRDLVVLQLGPLSTLDARFVEWLAEEYADAGVEVRRGWRDLLGGLVGAAAGGAS